MTRGPTTAQNKGDFRAKRFARLPFRAIPALAALITLAAPTPLAAQACKPAFAIKETRFSPAQNQQRTWTAVLSLDASHCAMTSGRFDITFIRMKENAPDLPFTETFTWHPGRIEVSLDFWWDEAVLDQWIGGVTACACTE